METIALAGLSAITIFCLSFLNYKTIKTISHVSDKILNHLHTHSRVGDLAINVEHKHKERLKELELEELKLTAAIQANKVTRERIYARVQDPQS